MWAISAAPKDFGVKSEVLMKIENVHFIYAGMRNGEYTIATCPPEFTGDKL